MKAPFFLVVLGVALCSSACQHTPTPPNNPPAAEIPIVGGDSDAHGCKGSAGYTWSALRQTCVRLFETGVALHPKATQLATTMVAYVVFAEHKSEAAVELFLPSDTTNVLLQKTEGKAKTWSGTDYVLTLDGNTYRLSNKQQQLLYESKP